MYQVLEQQDSEVEGSSSDIIIKLRVIFCAQSPKCCSINFDRGFFKINKDLRTQELDDMEKNGIFSKSLMNVSLHKQVNVQTLGRFTSSNGK